VTIAEALRPLGYVSASIGKWHLGGPAYYPEKQGFDVNIGGTDRGAPASYFFPYRSKTDSGIWQTSGIPGLEDGNEGDYLTDHLTVKAEKFIEHNKDRPFFLYFPHYALHGPVQAKKDLIAKYQAKAKANQEQKNPVYAAMVESVDDSVGRIMKKLEERKIADRTIVIFMSDNGGVSFPGRTSPPATSNAPLRSGKGYLYEGGIREPLIIKWPATVTPGSVCQVPVSSVDFFPTILEMAGGKTDAKQILDGVSLVSLLKQSGPCQREAVYWHYPHYHGYGGKPSGAIRKGDFKLIEFYEDGKLELYNLNDDLGEKVDLAAKMPDKAKELHQMLKDWRKSVNAQMPTPNPDFQLHQKK
jgi:arylsulfatase A-like enzyme